MLYCLESEVFLSLVFCVLSICLLPLLWVSVKGSTYEFEVGHL